MFHSALINKARRIKPDGLLLYAKKVRTCAGFTDAIINIFAVICISQKFFAKEL